MSARVFEASAPTRVDLAGGTLDIWPLSVMIPDAVTVNLAIELRAHARIEARPDDRVVVISKDRRQRVSRRLPVGLREETGPLAVLLRLVAAFRPQRGLTLETTAEAPAGAGLGGSSALGIAVGGALNRFTGEGLGRHALLRRVMNLETMQLRVPTGSQDYLAALYGGLSAFHYGFDGTTREPIPIPDGMEERVVLAYTGEPRESGFSNWDMFRRFIEGEAKTVERMEAIGRIALALRHALTAGDIDRAGRHLGAEGKLRYGLAPSVATPALRSAGDAARRAGALGVKACGAGGGGCLVAIAREGRARAVAEAIARTGALVLPAVIARKGLTVSER